MNTSKSKLPKKSSLANILGNKSSSKHIENPVKITKVSPSPSNSKVISRYVSPTATSKEKTKNSSHDSFKLFVGKQNKSQSKKKDLEFSSSSKENIHPNINSINVK